MRELTFSDGRIVAGDCLKVLVRDDCPEMDLIYVDPPFFSGKVRASQSGAYGDKWPSFDAYLDWLMARLSWMTRRLRSGGTLWVHLDHHAVHHVKVRLDDLLGQGAFRNEVIWCYNGGGVPRRDFPRKHDTLLRYVVGDAPATFHVLRRPFKENTQAVGRHSTYAPQVAIDLQRGTPITDWWDDINTVTGWSRERLGFPTQKPLKLMKRIIETTSNPGDLVADFFCGSGTTLVAARALGRRFFGTDRSFDAVRLASGRLAQVSLLDPEA